MKRTVVIGLGNPGEEYKDTYHNAGALALSQLARGRVFSLPDGNPQTLKGSPSRKLSTSTIPWKKYKDIFEYVDSKDEIFVKPMTYMNESGVAVREALKRFKATPAELVVIQDDSDITVGNYKISFDRNSGGHKGVQSIIDMLGTKAFSRIRIGIRPPREIKRKKAGEFALKKITPSHRRMIGEVIEKIGKESLSPKASTRTS